MDGVDEPLYGSMPEELVDDVAAFLRPWTTTPSTCWFGLWEGNGTWWRERMGVTDGDPETVAEASRIDEERDRVLRATPTFGTPQRQYFLMSGPLSAARQLTEAADGSSPNLWWSNDRAWLVSTEVDGYSSWVGGRASMIEELLGSAAIEAVATSLDARVVE